MTQVSTKDIAQHIGISQRSVSKVLLGGKSNVRVSQATRRRIEEAARELRFRPNAAVQAVTRGRFKNVAFLMSTEDQTSNVTTGLMHGLHDALAGYDMHLTVARLSDEELSDRDRIPRILREWSADGLLINYTHRVPPLMEELIDHYRLPAVWANIKRARDCVYPDDAAAGRLATEHLLELGHRRIAYLSMTESRHYSVADRRTGYCKAMEEAGCEPRVMTPVFECKSRLPSTFVDTRASVCRGLLANASVPTAVVTYSEGEVYPLLLAAAQSGIRVPEDLSVVGIGDRMIGLGVPVTTVWYHAKKMGRIMVDRLMKKIEEPRGSLPPLTVPYLLTRGASTASIRHR